MHLPCGCIIGGTLKAYPPLWYQTLARGDGADLTHPKLGPSDHPTVEARCEPDMSLRAASCRVFDEP